MKAVAKYTNCPLCGAELRDEQTELKRKVLTTFVPQLVQLMDRDGVESALRQVAAALDRLLAGDAPHEVYDKHEVH